MVDIHIRQKNQLDNQNINYMIALAFQFETDKQGA